MLRIHSLLGGSPKDFHEKWAIQLNDTHPAVAVAELMRLLIDEHDLGWDQAWSTTCATFAYTNHTLLPEALEKWTVDLFGTLLPRHLEIVFEINRRFLDEGRSAFPGDTSRVARLSLIDESGSRYVRMALSRASAATPSTASRKCTQSCSRRQCSVILANCGRENFAT